MTDAMQELFGYIQELRLEEFLPQKGYWRQVNSAAKRESALLATCTPQQKKLLEQYQNAHSLLQQQELEAMFQAAWAVARELS